MEILEDEQQETLTKEQPRKIVSFTYHGPTRKYSICGVLDEEKKQLRVGIALKNDKDNYSRRLGHRIALGRALKNPIGIVELDGDKPAKAFYGYARIYGELIEQIEDITISDTLSNIKAIIVPK